MNRRQKKPYKTIFHAMENTRVKNVTIVNFATVIILHLIATKIVVRMTSMKVLSMAHNGASTPCGTIKEEPQVYGEYENEIAPSIPCLVLGYLSTGYGYGVRYWNVDCEVWDDEQADDFECKKDKIEKWAYLDDLLPERKEDAE